MRGNTQAPPGVFANLMLSPLHNARWSYKENSLPHGVEE